MVRLATTVCLTATQNPYVRHKNSHNSLFIAYLLNHFQVALASLGRLYRQPLAAFMTIAVIAIALSLPTGLFIAVNNLTKLSNSWDGSTQISAFLHPHVDIRQALTLMDRLRLSKDIRSIELIDKEAGLAEFKKTSGFSDALKFLDSNPLPIVLVIQPELHPDRPDATAELVRQLEAEKLIELAQLDIQWVKRLFTLLEIANRSIWVIGSMLALAVLLIVGNTIRLDIQNRRQEIEVAKLIGASNAFIRRPFLYAGFWYGLLGGLLAWLLTSVSILLIEAPVHRLALLYDSDFSITGPGVSSTLLLLLISCTLSLSGSWLAVSRHLKDIEPS